MNSTHSNNFKIDSRFFKQELDSLIIKLTKAIAIEYQIPVNPDAKEITRKILLKKAHLLLSDDSETFIQEIKMLTKEKIKNKVSGFNKLYEFLKLMEIYDD